MQKLSHRAILFACLKSEKEELKIQNAAKIDIIAPAKLYPLPKNQNSLKNALG